MSTAHRVYVVADEVGNYLSLIASPNDRLTTRSAAFARTFASAHAAREWVGRLDGLAARRPIGRYEIIGLPATFFPGGELSIA